jgi:ATP-dependent DNA helicase RecG
VLASELLASLNSLDEHERIEAKRGSDVGKSLLETICAFSNEPKLGGGHILLGVERDDTGFFPAYSVVGVANPDKVSADIATQCREAFSRPIRVDIMPDRVDGKVVLVVAVAELQDHDKPLFLKSHGLPRGAFRRIGSTDQRCTEDDLAVLFVGREQESYDASIVADASMADLSDSAVDEYFTARAEANPDAEELRWSRQDLLQALGCIRRAEGAVEWKPTVAGLILFGTPVALRRCFPLMRVDYIRVPGREWIPDPDRRFDTIELRDSLFRLIRRAQAAIIDDLPKAFGLAEGELQRTETPIIPQRVIREAIVNALMHRSYRSHAPVQIIRYANRLEIRNPGFSLKSPEHLGEPGSQPRNPRIAAVLHETRFAETKGSGIRVMRETMERAGLTPPLFDSDRSADQFIARYLFHHFLADGDVAWLGRFRDVGLSDEEARALIYVREARAIDNATYRLLNRVDTLTASQSLRRLRDAQLLERHGRGSATFYTPGRRWAEDGVGRSFGASGPDRPSWATIPLSGESTAISGDLPSLSGDLPSLSGDLDAKTEQEEARRRLLQPLPGDLAARLGSLGRRSRPEDVRAVLAALLTHRAWSVDELALVLDRNPNYVRDQYLQPMVRNGEIRMTWPDEPNHPDQSYQAAVSG